MSHRLYMSLQCVCVCVYECVHALVRVTVCVFWCKRKSVHVVNLFFIFWGPASFSSSHILCCHCIDRAFTFPRRSCFSVLLLFFVMRELCTLYFFLSLSQVGCAQFFFPTCVHDEIHKIYMKWYARTSLSCLLCNCTQLTRTKSKLGQVTISLIRKEIGCITSEYNKHVCDAKYDWVRWSTTTPNFCCSNMRHADVPSGGFVAPCAAI